ncbi:MAG TPA: hypothetical protein VKB80_03310 [Kofleriaceae bacterium]|nr:hypothetical protein [Kofleriaceae bacterium]
MMKLQCTNREIKWQFAGETTPTATARMTRLDGILTRHRRRRVHAVARLVVFMVLCGALLAL